MSAKNYYNFEQSQTNIQYEPYLYDKGNSYAHLIAGAVAIIAGIVITALHIWKDAVGAGIVFGSILILNGLYRLLIEGKTKIELSKNEDALYKITPLGKRKKIALSNIYDIITSSENNSYTYDVTNKAKASAKSIPLTSFIDKSRQKKEEVIFMENEIIPAVHAFIGLDDAKTHINQTTFTNYNAAR